MQLAAAFAAALSLSFVAVEQVIAALLGGLVCIVPTAGFAVCATRWRKPGPIVLAGALKPLTIVGLIVAALVLARPEPLGFFAGLAMAHLAYLAAPFLDGAGWQGEGRKAKAARRRPQGEGRKAKGLESLKSGPGIQRLRSRDE